MLLFSNFLEINHIFVYIIRSGRGAQVNVANFEAELDREKSWIIGFDNALITGFDIKHVNVFYKKDFFDQY